MIKSFFHTAIAAAVTFMMLCGAYHVTRHEVFSSAHASGFVVRDTAIVIAGSASLGSGTEVVAGSGSGSSVILNAPIVPIDPATIDPVSSATGFLGFLTTGKYLPAIGILLMLVVWAERAGLARIWPWWAGKIGGYILGFLNPLLLYVGTALQAGTALTYSMLLQALGVAFVAAGGWSHLVDIFEAITGKQPAATVPEDKAVSK